MLIKEIASLFAELTEDLCAVIVNNFNKQEYFRNDCVTYTRAFPVVMYRKPKRRKTGKDANYS
jgi:hypothetical protein